MEIIFEYNAKKNIELSFEYNDLTCEVSSPFLEYMYSNETKKIEVETKNLLLSYNNEKEILTNKPLDINASSINIEESKDNFVDAYNVDISKNENIKVSNMAGILNKSKNKLYSRFIPELNISEENQKTFKIYDKRNIINSNISNLKIDHTKKIFYENNLNFKTEHTRGIHYENNLSFKIEESKDILKNNIYLFKSDGNKRSMEYLLSYFVSGSSAKEVNGIANKFLNNNVVSNINKRDYVFIDDNINPNIVINTNTFINSSYYNTNINKLKSKHINSIEKEILTLRQKNVSSGAIKTWIDSNYYVNTGKENITFYNTTTLDDLKSEINLNDGRFLNVFNKEITFYSNRYLNTYSKNIDIKSSTHLDTNIPTVFFNKFKNIDIEAENINILCNKQLDTNYNKCIDTLPFINLEIDKKRSLTIDNSHKFVEDSLSNYFDFNDKGKDELLLPYNDFDYSVYISQIFDINLLKPSNPIKVLDDNTFIAKYPVNNPLPKVNNFSIQYVDINVGLLIGVIKKLNDLWQEHIFTLGAYEMKEAVNLIIDMLDKSLVGSIPVKYINQYQRIIRLIKWYAEAAILKNSEYKIKVICDPLNSEFISGECKIPHTFNNMFLDTSRFVISNSILNDNARLELNIENRLDGKINTILYITNGYANIYFNDVAILEEITLSKFIVDIDIPKMIEDTPNKLVIEFIPYGSGTIDIANISITNMVYKNVEMEYVPKLGAGNKTFNDMKSMVELFADSYETTKDGIDKILKSNVAIAEVVDMLLNYYDLHHRQKDKGKRLTIIK